MPGEIRIASLPTDGHSLAAGEPVGLVAGWGELPVIVARSLRERGCRVITVGVAGHADPVLREISHRYLASGLGRMGQQAGWLNRQGVRRAFLAGKIFKSILFRRWAWLRHFPDPTTLRFFWGQFVTGRERRNDDRMLLTVTSLFASRGIEFMPATDFVPELLAACGWSAGPRLKPGQLKDVGMGWQLASEMGRLDVGQSVVVKGRAVLAVEAIEGTDECIRRAGQVCPAGGFTVVKVAKPHQDMRFDVPTIGPGTLRSMHEAGGRVLAIESGRTIVLGAAEVAKLARHWGISVRAFSAAEMQALAADAPALAPVADPADRPNSIHAAA